MDPEILLVDAPISGKFLKEIAQKRFGDLVKVVVDVQKGVMAIGGELHADQEACLLERGSRQNDLWGINLYPDLDMPAMVEFDSMINIRPSQKNRSRSVDDPAIQKQILDIIRKLVI